MEQSKLLDLLIQNDPQGFKHLFEQFKNKVFNTVLSYVQNQLDAEEITQDVFVEVHQSIRTFRQQSSLSTWIYRIAINKSLDFLKYKQRKKRFAFLQSLFHPVTGELTYSPPDFHHPGVALENKERAAMLFRAIHQLPDTQRTAFILAQLENLPHRDIADIMQTTISAVESLLHRAKGNLRKQLGDFYKNQDA